MNPKPTDRAALAAFTREELRLECEARAESPARLFGVGETERQFYRDLAAGLAAIEGDNG